jgi:hypothetical protein
MISRTVHYFRRVDEKLQDWRLGIETIEYGAIINPNNPDARGYSPTSYRDWRIIKKSIFADTTKSFVDYGAGLGRVVILAARLPFKLIRGVELDADLVRRANANIARANPPIPVQMLCVDAATYEVPIDATVLFFHNPFAGAILRATLGRIKDSYEKQRRPLQIVCNLPETCAFEGEIAAATWINLSSQFRLTDGRKCLIYTPAIVSV